MANRDEDTVSHGSCTGAHKRRANRRDGGWLVVGSDDLAEIARCSGDTCRCAGADPACTPVGRRAVVLLHVAGEPDCVSGAVEDGSL